MNKITRIIPQIVECKERVERVGRIGMVGRGRVKEYGKLELLNK